MREINYIVVHCTATQPEASVKAIQKFWREERGWKNPGYHFLIDRFGIVHTLAPLEQVVNGVKGFNSQSVHVSYIGGITKAGKPYDTRTNEQKTSMFNLLMILRQKFPDAIIQGHKDFSNVNKACPSFEAKDEYKFI